MSALETEPCLGVDDTICSVSGNSRQAKGREGCRVQPPATQAIPERAEQPEQGNSGRERQPAARGKENGAHSQDRSGTAHEAQTKQFQIAETF